MTQYTGSDNNHLYNNANYRDSKATAAASISVGLYAMSSSSSKKVPTRSRVMSHSVTDALLTSPPVRSGRVKSSFRFSATINACWFRISLGFWLYIGSQSFGMRLVEQPETDVKLIWSEKVIAAARRQRWLRKATLRLFAVSSLQPLSTVSIRCVVCFIKPCLRNTVLCVEWDVKPHIHSLVLLCSCVYG